MTVLKVIDEVFSKELDLTDQPVSNLDIKYSTDGSSLSGSAPILPNMQ
jgi:hypothetical protein